MNRHSWTRASGGRACCHCPAQRRYVDRESRLQKHKRIMVEQQRSGPDGEWSEERIACVDRPTPAPRRNRVVTLYGADATRAIEAERALYAATQAPSAVSEVEPDGADTDTEKWTITAPIRGEAWTTIAMPKGSTKRQAYDKAMDGEGIRWEQSWEFHEDARDGSVATATGPGCDQEDVGDAADDEPEPEENDE